MQTTTGMSLGEKRGGVGRVTLDTCPRICPRKHMFNHALRSVVTRSHFDLNGFGRGKGQRGWGTWDDKKQNGSICSPSLFPYLPRYLDLSTSCNPLREKKRRLKPDIAVFRYFKGGHVEEGADFLCVNPEGQS